DRRGDVELALAGIVEGDAERQALAVREERPLGHVAIVARPGPAPSTCLTWRATSTSSRAVTTRVRVPAPHALMSGSPVPAALRSRSKATHRNPSPAAAASRT